METLAIYDVVLIIGSALAGATLIAGLGQLLSRRMARTLAADAAQTMPVFLFDGEVLSDATDNAQSMIKDVPSNQTDLQAILTLFQDRFPTLGYIISEVTNNQAETITAADGSTQSMVIEDVDGMTRLSLHGATSDGHQELTDIAMQEGMTRELSFLRDVIDTTPQLAWTQDFTGKLTWANAAYMALSDQQSISHDGRTQIWPEAALFPELHLNLGHEPHARRAELRSHISAESLWFDVTSHRTNGGSMHFASPADDAVKAENSKTKAMQTSARLFANLATGLAIFDQRRQLAIFNPRLTDLTRLEPRFLMTRPTVDMFLDALRESRVLPEPKDYATWREQFSALENAARAGTYCENWDLIDGQTFRVTGKPYEDKSFVFLFDDMTAEVNLTRRFRTDIETGQGVMDAQEHAIAVFSANGTLVQSNRAYKEMWDRDLDTGMAPQQLRSEIMNWQSRCAAAPSWNDLRTYIAGGDRQEKWVDHLILDDGRDIVCEAQGLNTNMTMVSFKGASDKKIAPVIHKLTMSDPSLQSAKR